MRIVKHTLVCVIFGLIILWGVAWTQILLNMDRNKEHFRVMNEQICYAKHRGERGIDDIDAVLSEATSYSSGPTTYTIACRGFDALATIGTPKALSVIRKYLGAGRASIRRSACERLGEKRDIESLRAITKLLDDSDSSVRGAARKALDAILQERGTGQGQVSGRDSTLFRQAGKGDTFPK